MFYYYYYYFFFANFNWITKLTIKNNNTIFFFWYFIFCGIKNGQTALLFAVEEGSLPIVTILIAANANINVKDNVSI